MEQFLKKGVKGLLKISQMSLSTLFLGYPIASNESNIVKGPFPHYYFSLPLAPPEKVDFLKKRYKDYFEMLSPGPTEAGIIQNH